MALPESGSSRNEKKRRLEEIEISTGNLSPNIDSWAKFLVIEAADNLPIKLNPFAVSKAVSGICGEVKNVTRLRSGSLLVECALRQQSLNLLSISTFANIEVAVSEHRTLNSCRGIVRDRARCLSDMSEEEIATELADQAVTAVKRFTFKKDGVITNTNTYLMTFARTTLPQSIKAGYFHIGVDVYVPNPLRCYKCQRFGHGSKSCRNSVVCHRCGANHESTDCETDLKCANCTGPHVASSKSCPVWQIESQIMKLKCERNIPYLDAKKLLKDQSTTPSTISYSAAVSRPVATSSISCQTDLTWVKSEQPVATIPNSTISKPIPAISQSTSGSQTEIQSETQSQPSGKQPANLGKKEKKKLSKKQPPIVPSPSEVTLHNSFGPLDMEVTLSSQDRRRSSSSSHSRERSPIEPP
ncbi:uncharacterized protein [Haliotis cracherodii]|uniref:uncharacterized protein n=1 Tax=Haliotis cracherodii TaxID=6455 RepID=UPI0039EC88C4